MEFFSRLFNLVVAQYLGTHAANRSHQTISRCPLCVSDYTVAIGGAWLLSYQNQTVGQSRTALQVGKGLSAAAA